MRKLIAGVLAGLIIIGGGWLIYVRYQDMKIRRTQKNNIEKIISVSVKKIIRSDMLQTMLLFGTVKAFNQVDVYAKISGRVEELRVRNGTEVKLGDILAVLEHSVVHAQTEQAAASLEAVRAQLKQINVNLANLKRELDRIYELSREGAVSESKKDQIETQYNVNLAQKEAVEAQVKQLGSVLQQAKINLAEANVSASISGIVAQKYIDAGDMVTPQKPIFTLMQVDRVKMTAVIPETILAQVKVGQTHAMITVDAYPDRQFDGMVTYIAPSVDPRNRTLEIEIEMENSHNILKAGMFCRIELVLDRKIKVIAVPKDLLVYDISGGNKEYYIYTVEGGVAKKNLVVPGIYSYGLVELKEGLNEGDSVITSVGPHIFDECKVSIVGAE